MMNELTNEERLMISQIAADLESGNHLLRPRSNEYRKFMKSERENHDYSRGNLCHQYKYELIEELTNEIIKRIEE